jgi:hypothetical protein
MNKDITFCVNHVCQKKSKCKRYLKNYYQLGLVSQSLFNEKNCEFYIELKKL